MMKQTWITIGGTAIALGIGSGASAQSFPTKPVRMVIGFAPGGPADIAGRIIGPRLSEALGQQVIVENRGGAGGTIGMDVVVKAPPDGYTIGLGSSGNLVMAPHLYPKTYSVQKDLAPISQLAVSAFVI